MAAQREKKETFYFKCGNMQNGILTRKRYLKSNWHPKGFTQLWRFRKTPSIVFEKVWETKLVWGCETSLYDFKIFGEYFSKQGYVIKFC